MRLYLGDGVYVDFDGWSIILTTEDGVNVTNRIVLEPEVVNALLQFLNKLRGVSE